MVVSIYIKPPKEMGYEVTGFLDYPVPTLKDKIIRILSLVLGHLSAVRISSRQLLLGGQSHGQWFIIYSSKVLNSSLLPPIDFPVKS